MKQWRPSLAFTYTKNKNKDIKLPNVCFGKKKTEQKYVFCQLNQYFFKLGSKEYKVLLSVPFLRCCCADSDHLSEWLYCTNSCSRLVKCKNRFQSEQQKVASLVLDFSRNILIGSNSRFRWPCTKDSGTELQAHICWTTGRPTPAQFTLTGLQELMLTPMYWRLGTNFWDWVAQTHHFLP